MQFIYAAFTSSAKKIKVMREKLPSVHSHGHGHHGPPTDVSSPEKHSIIPSNWIKCPMQIIHKGKKFFFKKNQLLPVLQGHLASPCKVPKTWKQKLQQNPNSQLPYFRSRAKKFHDFFFLIQQSRANSKPDRKINTYQNQIKTRLRSNLGFEAGKGEKQWRIATNHMTAHKPFPVTTCHRFGLCIVKPL